MIGERWIWAYHHPAVVGTAIIAAAALIALSRG